MTEFDPRLTPARNDLAADFLRGKVQADKYVAGDIKTVCVMGGDPASPLHQRPDVNSGRETELLYGEKVHVFENQNGWSWVQSESDDYVGYTPSINLVNGQQMTTHYIRALRTYVFSEPNIKSKPVALLSMNSPLNVRGVEDKFLCLDEGFVTADHCARLDDVSEDYVQTALMFLGTPYLWGGRTSLGLDCSALVQNALARSGFAVPRDTDMQQEFIGDEIATTLADNPPLQRGDLIFWKGHVGIMVDADHMVHANGTWMQVTLDPLRDFARKVSDETGPVIKICRLPE